MGVLLRLFLWVVIASILEGTQCQQTANKTKSDDCIELVTNVQLAYEGWFHRLQCNFGGFLEKVNHNVPFFSPDYVSSAEKILCTIYNATGEMILNGTNKNSETTNACLVIPDVKSEKVPIVFQANYQLPSRNKCGSQLIKLNVTVPETQQCSTKTVITTAKVPQEGDLETLGCAASSGQPELFPCDSSSYTIRWWHNCGNLTPNAEVFDNGRKIRFQSITLKDPGIYTCAVTHNGLTRYVNRELCVRPREAKSAPIIRCAKNEYLVTLGQNLTLECTVVLGHGSIIRNAFLSLWRKNSSHFECHPEDGKVVYGEQNSTHSCENVVKEYKKYCLPVITDSNQHMNETKITMKLYLRNVQASDLGNYTVKAINNNILSKYYVLVKETTGNEALSPAQIIILVLGIIIFIIMITGLAYCFRFYISFFTKKWFGTYEEDDKPYAAFLSYHFSTESDKFAQEQVRYASAAVRDVLDGMGFRVYDEKRDGLNGFRMENATNLMDKCHRVIIILTAQYVSDNWSVFQLQQSFLRMIESRSRLIFILPPGVKEYIKQRSVYDETHRMIQRALEINHVIAWSPKPQFNKKLFKMKVSHAMPKLRPVDAKRLPSSLSDKGGYVHGISRFLSNATTTTEVFYDVSDPAENG